MNHTILGLSGSQRPTRDWNVADIANKAYDLEGKTVRTVGRKRIGRLLLQRLKPFGCNLLYHDHIKMDLALENQISASYEEDLDKILPKCDIVAINTHLIEKTNGDVWYSQPAQKDHPWRYMPNQVIPPLTYLEQPLMHKFVHISYITDSYGQSD
ncbi:putative formate dehydrogenase [Helianthus annuus]|nr:putative formate dehydrogenase [Helianthus annuus]